MGPYNSTISPIVEAKITTKSIVATDNEVSSIKLNNNIVIINDFPRPCELKTNSKADVKPAICIDDITPVEVFPTPVEKDSH